MDHAADWWYHERWITAVQRAWKCRRNKGRSAMWKQVSLFLALAFWAQAAVALPRFVHLSWNKPDTATTMTVTWMSDSVNDPSFVQYGIAAPGQLEAEGTAFKGNDALEAIHSVEIEGLTPSTTYQYRVGGPGGWSDTYSFTTGPAGKCEPFRFAAFGDNRPDTDWLPQFHWNPILAETAETEPAFLLHTGDIVKKGKETDQWNTFFDNSEPYLGYIPFMATIGNHDDGPADGDGANYNQIFSFPTNPITGTEDYYFFIYGNAIFVSLCTQNFDEGNPPFSVQAGWLDQVLTQHPMKWKFVFLHHPPYTSHMLFDLIFTEFEFNHPPNENDQNEALVPIFDKHHVDIVFAGHNHYYERLGPMVGGTDPEQGQPVATFYEGTTYVITGGAGAMVYDEFDILGIQIDLIDWVCGEAAGSEVCTGKHHYTIVDIEDNQLHFEAWATAEQTLGNNPGNVFLIDSFTMLKQPTENCEEDPPPPDIVEEGPDIVETADFEIVSPAEPQPEIVPQPDPGGEVGTQPERGDPASSSPEASAWQETVQGDAACADGSCAGTDNDQESSADAGCGCRIQAAAPVGSGPLLVLLAVTLLLLALRRRAGAARRNDLL